MHVRWSTCVLPQATLTMLPRPGGTVVLSPDPNKAVDLANANVSLVNPRPGDANIRVTLAPVANSTSRLSLQWSDTTLPFPGIVRTGTYQVMVHIPGLRRYQFHCVRVRGGQHLRATRYHHAGEPSVQRAGGACPRRELQEFLSTSILHWSTSRSWVIRRASGSLLARTERSPGPPPGSQSAWWCRDLLTS